jgi:branched-chain amino acid transport system ATP-binding protein
MSALEVKDLGAGYGNVKVLHGVSLRVETGEGIVAVMGANGAGKTTLCRVISGILPATSGSIASHGRELTRLSPRDIVRTGVGHVPEARQIFAQMTVEENLIVGAYTRNDDEIPAAVHEMYERFPILWDRRNQLAGVLSGGEQQMLAVARALMARPRLLILDEPTHGLAPAMVDDLVDMLFGLVARGVGVLLVEQNVAMAERAASRVVLLSNGRVVAEGEGREIFGSDIIQRVYMGDTVSSW